MHRHGGREGSSLTGFDGGLSFREGLKRFLAWAEQSSPSTAGYEHSLAEMRDRGLLRDGS